MDRVARHPLARAVRADKTCLAGLAATLRHYVRGEAAARIPVWRMISTPPEAIRARVTALCAELAGRGVTAEIDATTATVGGGSLPGERLASFAVRVVAHDADELARHLRLGSPAVFGRIERHRLLLDLRTVLPEDDARLAEAVATAVAATG